MLSVSVRNGSFIINKEYKINMDSDLFRKIAGDAKSINNSISSHILNSWAEHLKEWADPEKIEEESINIIETVTESIENARERYLFSKIVHAAGDFRLIDLIRMSPGFVDTVAEKLRDGCRIVVDAKMVKAGIYNKNLLDRCRIMYYGDDERVDRISKQMGITKSASAMRIASEDGVRDAIFVIGNAPTALIELLNIVRDTKEKPPAVIGVPVGFVQAARAKYSLVSSGIDYLTILGSRGGSPIAASVINAFGVMLDW
ncbi:precorrin-8x methylmutase [Thermoplasma volcanium GSS1]|uniref:Precorrin-8x methylmutase n=1 Tax=Thermoplasma volcanium (strain ATCC 51530 / DSM 4299 / JCM 9571 / NBRC 15438 / GSS1) TaxID=273116 RepID=Q97A61_THEVO|nr:precorrin-8x methylmutase [Thermoplasma volcanium GSS1]